ncbi:unnamed protein product [Moneuplotes crassus]|uniref:Archaemetzincin-2 n=1 Tax=Euplotes crassus TaxID=5936 RepID=A0AAD1XK59_EUPCR|nr:unnamed protein product [Moneuplotes crassus]
MKKTTDDLDGNKDLADPRAKAVFSQEFIEGRFDRMRILNSGEWIPCMENKPQSYPAYLKSNPNKLFETRKTIYILGLDESISMGFLENCRKYCEAFYFGLPVKILDNIDVKELNVKSRGKSDSIQYSAKQILTKAKRKIPKDAYAMICVLNKDIYSREDWNFVFGYASLRARIGVFSFARYDPSFFNDDHGMTSEEVEDTVQFRGIKVMCHEIGHMFGLKHCTYYRCIMNGSMSSEEALLKPCYLCPICLKKLYFVVQCDILSRYQALNEACEISQLFEETSKWYSEAIDYLQDQYTAEGVETIITPKYPIPRGSKHVSSSKPSAKPSAKATCKKVVKQLR